jgi:hypothetical protein
VNPSDEIRDKILRHLYDVHENAKSPKSAGLLVSQLQKAMRTAHGYKQQAVASNLDYSCRRGGFARWRPPAPSRRRAVRRFRPLGSRTRSRTWGWTSSRTPRRTAVEHLSRINVTKVAGVTVIGDGNVVNTALTDLSRALDRLEDAVAESDACPRSSDSTYWPTSQRSTGNSPSPSPTVVSSRRCGAVSRRSAPRASSPCS